MIVNINYITQIWAHEVLFSHFKLNRLAPRNHLNEYLEENSIKDMLPPNVLFRAVLICPSPMTGD